MKKNRGTITIFLICALFAFFLTLQLRSVQNNTRVTNDLESMRSSDLQAKLNTEYEKNASLTEELNSFKEQLAKYRDEASNAGDYTQLLSEELKRAELLAGLTDVSGPGLIVTMEDGKIKTDIVDGAVQNPNLFIIHDGDILSVLNELRDAGAEALSLNGARILATSEVRCAGSTVSINNERYAVPFVINAIGDPATLESALTMQGGIVDYLAEFGIKVTIEKKDKLTIAGYNGSLQYKYAKQDE